TIFNLCMAVLDKDDEAIIPAPYWVSYPDMVMLADGQPVMPFAGAAQGYKITARQLAAAITPKTRLLLLNSPCNPTGAAYTRAELRALGEVLLEHPRIVIINGVSKAYAMTGWRIGYCGGPKELIAAMSTIQGQSTSNASSISQKAATAALAGDQACVGKMNEAFKQRHDYVVGALNALPGVSCLPGAGTFYAFADVSKAMAGLGCATDGEFAALLLNEGGVAVVPGSGFGAPGHMRISFACSLQTLEKAIERLARVLATGGAVATRSPGAILDGVSRPAGLGAGMGPSNSA